jgi:hypothetical protein
MGALIVPQILSAPQTLVSEAPGASSPASPSDAVIEESTVDGPSSDVSEHEYDEEPALTVADSKPMSDASASTPASVPAPLYDYEPSALMSPSSSPSPGKIISVVLAIALPVLTAALLGGHALLKRRKARAKNLVKNKTEN